MPAKRMDGPATSNFIDLYKRGCFVLEAKQGRKRSRRWRSLRPLGLDMRGAAHRLGARGTRGWDDRHGPRARPGETATPASSAPREDGRPSWSWSTSATPSSSTPSSPAPAASTTSPSPTPAVLPRSTSTTCDERSATACAGSGPTPWVAGPGAAQRPGDARDRRASRAAGQVPGNRLIALPAGSGEKESANATHRRVSPTFLMRCLFTMFAEDVGLLPDRSFTQLLAELAAQRRPASRPWSRSCGERWTDGGFSVALRCSPVPPLQRRPVRGRDRAAADRRPAPAADRGGAGRLARRGAGHLRHAAGARARPARARTSWARTTRRAPTSSGWCCRPSSSRCAPSGRRSRPPPLLLAECGASQPRRWPRCEALPPPAVPASACSIPACGFGQLPLRHAGAPEAAGRRGAEALARRSGEDAGAAGAGGQTVDPHQFLGLEVNPRAAAIAELVLWIGYLQWHFRTRGDATAARADPARTSTTSSAATRCWPGTQSSRCWTTHGPARHPLGRPTRPRLHPVTGEEVPDAGARCQPGRYVNPRPAEWPEADFVVGNPPFIGGAHARGAGRRLCRGLRRPGRTCPAAPITSCTGGTRRPRPLRKAGKAHRALRLHHHQQPAPDLQPPGAGTPPERARRRCRCSSPSPTIRGWTAPTGRPCASP